MIIVDYDLTVINCLPHFLLLDYYLALLFHYCNDPIPGWPLTC